jgi:hypothetical protein
LRHLLNNYKEKGTDIKIINDPDWRDIVNQAKIVLEKWRKT